MKLNETLELESAEANDSFPRDQSLGSEIDGSHIPENLRLRFWFISIVPIISIVFDNHDSIT